MTLSGGQKQRAAIARALTRNAPVMIFDDSLSAVDTETDSRIREALEKRFGSATVILISHRLTTVSRADKVILLDNGRIAEEGSPEELKTSGGLYQQIYEIQSGILPHPAAAAGGQAGDDTGNSSSPAGLTDDADGSRDSAGKGGSYEH